MESVGLTFTENNESRGAAPPFANAYAGRRALVTGHTGFKGSWLAFWLSQLGADTSGAALDPADDQRLFNQLELSSRLVEDARIDIRDAAAVDDVIRRSAPEFLFHLAAQPLVRESYNNPSATFDVNVQGVVNVLDAVRRLDHPCAVVVVTTDKCYENRNQSAGYAEDDRLGGHDPYSASKACAELVAASYRRSFFADGSRVRLATARAGNVIGGGDWSRDRIVPDCIRALRRGEPIPVRNRSATRPWQHVLEPVSGYLWLAAAMRTPDLLGAADAAIFCEAFNFGPAAEDGRTVAELVEELLLHTPGQWLDASDSAAVHEAARLHLAIDKAQRVLGWRPVWNFDETVRRTAEWYAAEQHGADLAVVTRQQIVAYYQAAQAAEVAWIK